jgi:hypothetical protein
VVNSSQISKIAAVLEPAGIDGETSQPWGQMHYHKVWWVERSLGKRTGKLVDLGLMCFQIAVGVRGQPDLGRAAAFDISPLLSPLVHCALLS